MALGDGVGNTGVVSLPFVEYDGEFIDFFFGKLAIE